MQVSPLNAKAFKEEISHELPKQVAEDNKKMWKAVDYAKKKDIKVYNLTFMQAAKTIYTREGLTGFMRGFTPSMLKNTLNAGTYFGMLYYFENFYSGFGVLPVHLISILSSASAKTI
jgi:predicted PolB exonuclease-like 3'-5' exonuclease